MFKIENVVFLLLTLAVILVSLLKSNEIFIVNILVVECKLGGDKYLHFYLSILLGVAAMFRCSKRYLNIIGHRVLILFILFFGDEFTQLFF
ncbi:hypothetical protein OAP63_15115, partial [Vibrio sp.]|nr:hypothetical protein [Vibrio sp.]